MQIKAADRTDKDLCNYLGRKLQSFSFKLKHFKDSVSLSWAGAFKFMYLKTPTKLQYIGYALICVKLFKVTDCIASEGN